MRGLRLKNLTWREFGRRFVKEFQEDTVTDCAAQLAYYFLFSLFPLLFFLVTLAAYLPFAHGAVEAMLARVSPLVPGQALAIIQQQLHALVNQPRPRLLTLGLVVALWSASRGMDALRTALNLAYDVSESRPYWKTQGVAMLMTIAGTLLIPVSFTVFLLGGRVGEWLAERLHVEAVFYLLWSWLRWPFTAALVMLMLALCYYVLPDVKQRFRYITPGSVLGTALWLASTWGFTQYVEHFGNYNVTYGSIGGVVVLMLWLYISGLIVILGGELNAILEHASHDAEAKAKGARAPGEPPLEPPLKTPGAAKSASSARKTARSFWRWRRRASRREPPNPTLH